MQSIGSVALTLSVFVHLVFTPACRRASDSSAQLASVSIGEIDKKKLDYDEMYIQVSGIGNKGGKYTATEFRQLLFTPGLKPTFSLSILKNSKTVAASSETDSKCSPVSLTLKPGANSIVAPVCLTNGQVLQTQPGGQGPNANGTNSSSTDVNIIPCIADTDPNCANQNPSAAQPSGLRVVSWPEPQFLCYTQAQSKAQCLESVKPGLSTQNAIPSLKVSFSVMSKIEQYKIDYDIKCGDGFYLDEALTLNLTNNGQTVFSKKVGGYVPPEFLNQYPLQPGSYQLEILSSDAQICGAIANLRLSVMGSGSLAN